VEEWGLHAETLAEDRDLPHTCAARCYTHPNQSYARAQSREAGSGEWMWSKGDHSQSHGLAAGQSSDSDGQRLQ
jgi:hypothetical protein